MGGVVPVFHDSKISSNGTSVPPRRRFRAFLIERVTTAHGLQFYMDQAVPQFTQGAEVRLAVEELVDHAGRMLGFSVERDEGREWSVWTSPATARLIVGVETAAEAAAGIGQFTRRRDEAATPESYTPAEPMTGLTVVCGGGNRRLLEDAVVVRRAADQVRLITIDALIRLVAHARSGRASHAQALTILRPPGAFADPLVPLLDR